MGKVSTLRWQKTRWALVRVPNERFAQQAHVSYEKMMDLFFDACALDWEQYLKENRRIAVNDDRNQAAGFATTKGWT